MVKEILKIQVISRQLIQGWGVSYQVEPSSL